MIYITGDTHRELDYDKLSIKRFPEQQNLTKNDYLIIAGDFGGLWYGGTKDAEYLKRYDEKPFTTLWVDGNHENFTLLENYKITKWNGGKIHKITDNIYHLMRGQVFNIDGNTIFTMGGGLSIDRGGRIPFVSWWPQEQPSIAEEKEAFDNLEKVNYKVDYIISHVCPIHLKSKAFDEGEFLFNVKDEAEVFLREISNITEYKKWYCGHYHKDKEIKDGNIRVLYQDVVRIGE